MRVSRKQAWWSLTQCVAPQASKGAAAQAPQAPEGAWPAERVCGDNRGSGSEAHARAPTCLHVNSKQALSWDTRAWQVPLYSLRSVLFPGVTSPPTCILPQP